MTVRTIWYRNLHPHSTILSKKEKKVYFYQNLLLPPLFCNKTAQTNYGTQKIMRLKFVHNRNVHYWSSRYDPHHTSSPRQWSFPIENSQQINRIFSSSFWYPAHCAVRSLRHHQFCRVESIVVLPGSTTFLPSIPYPTAYVIFIFVFPLSSLICFLSHTLTFYN